MLTRPALRRAAVLGAALALSAPTALVSSAHGVLAQAAKPKVTQSGFTFVPGGEDETYAGYVTGGAVVENPTEKVASAVEVTFIVKDRQGRKITDDRYTIPYIAPGEEAYAVWVSTYPETKVPVSMSTKLDVTEMFTPRAWSESVQYEFGGGDFNAEPPSLDDVALEFSDLRYQDSGEPGEGPTGGLASSIIGTVRATSGKELTGVVASCAAFENGEVVGGGAGAVHIIPEGADAGVQAINLLGGLTPDEIRCNGAIEHLYGRVGPLEAELVTQEAGFATTDIGDYTMGAAIENPSDLWAWGVDVSFDVLDASGRVIGSRPSTDFIYIPPHSVTYVSPENSGTPGDFAGTPASLRVVADAGRFAKAGKEIKDEAGFNPAAWKFEFDDVALDGDGHIKGTITSRSKKALNALDITCGLYRDGAIVTATVDSFDESELGGGIRPGKPVEFELGVVLQATGADDIRCVGQISQMSDV